MILYLEYFSKLETLFRISPKNVFKDFDSKKNIIPMIFTPMIFNKLK